MEKLNRLVWASGISVEAYGMKIGIRCNEPILPPEVIHCLPPGWQPSSSPFVDLLYSFRMGKSDPGSRVRHYHLLYMGLTHIARTMNLEEVYQALEGNLQIAIGEHSSNFVFLHAGVVGWRGKSLIFPGRSFAGKTTLVAALLKRGAIYYSDEYAVVDQKGRVHPYPRQLAMRKPEGHPDRHIGPEELGSSFGVEPIPVGQIVLTQYRKGSSWKPRVIPVAQSLCHLIPFTLPMIKNPDRSLSALQQAVRPAIHLKGNRGEAEETADLILAQAN